MFDLSGPLLKMIAARCLPGWGPVRGATLRPNTSNADVIRVFHPIPFDSYFEAMRSYTTGSLSLVKAMLDYDEQLRVIRAYCKHTQKLSFTIRLDPAGQPKERKCVTLTFCCEECGAVREFVGDHVKVTDEECAMRGLVAEDSGWQVSREPT